MTGDVDRAQVRALWKAHGGDWHGPNVEHFSIPEYAGFWPFIRAYCDQREREALEKALSLIEAAERALSLIEAAPTPQNIISVCCAILALIQKDPAND